MQNKTLVIVIGFFISVFWVGYLLVNTIDGVLVDGIVISAVVVTVLAVVFSMVSWFLLSWASKNILIEGLLMNVIIGVAVITPFNGLFGPMAAILVGVGTGVLSHVIQKR